jgi:membrane protein required for colicin V production
LNSIDIVLALLVGVSTLGGLLHGFSRVVVGLVAALAGIVLGFWFYGIAARPLLGYVSRPEIANALGFLIVLGACVLAGTVLGRILAAIFKWVGLSWMDRLLGGVAGFARGMILAAALMTVVLACVGDPPPAAIVDSRMMPYVLQASRLLAEMTPRELRDAFEATEGRLKGMWDKARPVIGGPRHEGRV